MTKVRCVMCECKHNDCKEYPCCKLDEIIIECDETCGMFELKRKGQKMIDENIEN